MVLAQIFLSEIWHIIFLQRGHWTQREDDSIQSPYSHSVAVRASLNFSRSACRHTIFPFHLWSCYIKTFLFFFVGSSLNFFAFHFLFLHLLRWVESEGNSCYCSQVDITVADDNNNNNNDEINGEWEVLRVNFWLIWRVASKSTFRRDPCECPRRCPCKLATSIVCEFRDNCEASLWLPVCMLHSLPAATVVERQS